VLGGSICPWTKRVVDTRNDRNSRDGKRVRIPSASRLSPLGNSVWCSSCVRSSPGLPWCFLTKYGAGCRLAHITTFTVILHALYCSIFPPTDSPSKQHNQDNTFWYTHSLVANKVANELEYDARSMYIGLPWRTMGCVGEFLHRTVAPICSSALRRRLYERVIAPVGNKFANPLPLPFLF
jgi:hypothetical protein